MSRGLLIVTADDFGFSQSVTDSVIDAYGEHLISSTSAMVWMPDSERAAALARERGMPVGLHLNFTLPFRADEVPTPARELQAEIAAMFDASSSNENDVRRARPAPRMLEAIGHQLEAFRERFGEPTHIDGHHHIHLHPAVLVCLPHEYPVRLVLRAPNRLRSRRDRRERLMRESFRTADGCVSLPQIHPWLGGAGLEALSFARKRTLEVIVHVQLAPERRAIQSAEWRAALAPLQLGSQRDL